MLFFFELFPGNADAAFLVVVAQLSGRKREEEEAFLGPQGRSEGKLAFCWQDDAALSRRAKEVGRQALDSFVAVRGGETEGLYLSGFVEEALVQEWRGRGGRVGWWGGGERGEALRRRARCRRGGGGGDEGRLEAQHEWRPGGWWWSVGEDEMEGASGLLVV